MLKGVYKFILQGGGESTEKIAYRKKSMAVGYCDSGLGDDLVGHSG